jgi:lipopolysaccharide cholinephosphotransferase
MKKINLTEIRKIQLELLQNFHEFCVSNNLRYFLDAGTLLGAIRHKGYIPWDDDIDVGMPRLDYDEFIKRAGDGYKNSLLLLPKDTNNSYLKIIDKRTILIEYTKEKTQKIGIYIDVYPKDGLPNMGLRVKFRYQIIKILTLKHWYNKVTLKRLMKSRNIIKKIIGFLTWPLCHDQTIILHLIDRLSRKYSFDESKYCATMVSGGLNNCVLTNVLNEYEIKKFEELSLFVPKKYDIYLKKLYGNYENLPPLSKRFSNHKFEAFFKDDLVN